LWKRTSTGRALQVRSTSTPVNRRAATKAQISSPRCAQDLTGAGHLFHFRSHGSRDIGRGEKPRLEGAYALSHKLAGHVSIATDRPPATVCELPCVDCGVGVQTLTEIGSGPSGAEGGRWTCPWRSHSMQDFEDVNYQPRSVKCVKCERIFIKNERIERFCPGCLRSQRAEKFGLGTCGRCGEEFDRRAPSQRYCSDDCRESSRREGIGYGQRLQEA
jgi:hypothetical protein